jgi:hypothetical protein
MFWYLVCLIAIYFTPVHLMGFALPTFHGKVFITLLPVDVLKGFVSGSFPRLRAAREILPKAATRAVHSQADLRSIYFA